MDILSNNLSTNCRNCGAVMEYNKQYYGSMYKCPYCRTEHHIDKLGRIEEYKVKFMWQGRLIEAYLNAYSVEPTYIEATRLCDTGRMTYITGSPTLTFEFTGYVVEENK